EWSSMAFSMAAATSANYFEADAAAEQRVERTSAAQAMNARRSTQCSTDSRRTEILGYADRNPSELAGLAAIQRKRAWLWGWLILALPLAATVEARPPPSSPG